MNNEPILKQLAAEIRLRLSDENPIKGALYTTVAEAKEEQHTYAVLQTAKTQAKEIVPGNYTWRYPCRLWAMFYPPEDERYTADAFNAWMEEAALALVAACAALLEGKYNTWAPLDATVTGPLQWAASDAGGYEGSIPFSLVIQF